MSEEKFTKGHWALISTDFHGEFNLTTEERIDDSKVPILTIDTGYSGVIGDEQKANANLIASAPKMYSKLQSIVDSGNLQGSVENEVLELLAEARGESV